MYIQNTLVPYAEIEHKGIQYTTCRDYSHISRQSCLRQVVHNPEDEDRFIALETANGFSTHADVVYHDVRAYEENRLDVLAYQYLGSAQYAWVIALFNNIEDGYTIHEGQRLVIPKSISSLFSKGEILAPVPALKLNLGAE